MLCYKKGHSFNDMTLLVPTICVKCLDLNSESQCSADAHLTTTTTTSV